MEPEKKPKNDETKQLYILLLFAVYSQLGYSLLAPLYPIEAKMRGVDSSLVGIIFSSYGISNFIFTIFTPNFIKIFGRKKLLIFSLLIEGTCTCFFGLINNVTNRQLFIILSFAIRFSQGMGSALMETLLYSIVASISTKSNIEKNIGYIELADSIGVAIGPVIASLSYHLFGFLMPFLLCGMIEMSGALLINYIKFNKKKKIDDKKEEISILDKEINEKKFNNIDNEKNKENEENEDEEEEEEDDEEEQEKLKEENEENEEYTEEDLEEEEKEEDEMNVNVIVVLVHKFILLIFLAVIFDEVSLSFIYPVFAIYLKTKYKVDPESSSLFFVISTVSYFFALQIIGIVIKKLGNIYTMIFGLFLNAFFILFLGPISILPQKIIFVIIGLSGLGISGAFISIPAVIEVIKLLNVDMKFNSSTSEDYSSALFHMGFFIGQTTGPLIGGAVTEMFSFSTSSIIICAITLIVALSFLGIKILDGKNNKNGNIIEEIDEAKEIIV